MANDMKVTLECAHCLLERAINQIKLATEDPDLQMEVVEAITKFLGDNFSGESVPSHIGTDRDLLVQEMTGKDPYETLKRMSNEMALNILPELQELVAEQKNSTERFRIATLIAAAANAIEFDVTGREFSLDELRVILGNVESDLVVDQVNQFRELCKGTKEVLYLMDNAGEIVLDMILIKEIKKLGPKVIAVVRGGPVLNDATMIDAEEIALSECADEVRDTGAPAIGVNLERNSEEFIELFHSAKLIVAKGMGNFESMTEFEPSCPTVHIMRTKCNPVADFVGVPRNKNVVLIRSPPE
ncbi:MAG: damage-control phosphatase ARMT1 family protein [Candidatus Thorarchaeota archaeon]